MKPFHAENGRIPRLAFALLLALLSFPAVADVLSGRVVTSRMATP